MKKFLLLMAGLVTAACITTGCDETQSFTNNNPTTPVAGLTQFHSCDELIAFFDEVTATQDEPFLENDAASSGGTGGDGADLGAPEAANDAADTASVEQADIVKHIGNRLYVLSVQVGLLVYDVSNPVATELLSQIKLDFTPQEFFVDGDTVAIIGAPSYQYPIVAEASNSIVEPVGSQVAVYDLSDTDNPELLKTLFYRGFYSDSRKVASTVYLVTQQWISPYLITDYSDDESECKKSYAPSSIKDEPYFYSVVAWQINTIDLNNLSNLSKPITVFGGNQSQITASPDFIYLSNYFYGSDKTAIFTFDISNPSVGVIPRSHGSVPGIYVNQFSMDEYAGHFRIATTTNRTTFGADDNRNYVSAFDVNNGFKLVGQNGLIAPGESITAARFIEDTAYLTTFVTKDPLITIDLSNPADIKIIGELDVPGFPTHIHVWGDLLISIGSEQEFWGRVILSLFDISDLSQPTLIEQITIEESDSSEAQREHRAFSFFEDRGILAIPIQYEWSKSYTAVYDVDAVDGFTLLSQINHDDLIEDASGFSPRMRRALDIANALYTVSEAGLKANSFFDLDDELFGELFPGFEVPDFGCYWELCGPITID